MVEREIFTGVGMEVFSSLVPVPVNIIHKVSLTHIVFKGFLRDNNETFSRWETTELANVALDWESQRLLCLRDI